MDTFYCVLWMPTVIHSEFETPIRNESDIFEISDSLPDDLLEKNKDTHLWAKLFFKEEHGKSKNILIDIYSDKKGKFCLEEYRLEFVYKDHSHNGLFKYMINLPDEHILFHCENDGSIDFPCDIYHKIKEFYHSHEYHRNEHGDAILKPYITTSDVDLKEENNAAIIHYFHQYGNKFLEEYNSIKRLYASIKSSRKAEFLYFFRSKKYRSFFALVATVKGDKIYYNTLQQSCYNTLFRINTVNPGDKVEEEVKKERRIAFNIDNIVNNVSSFEASITNKFTLSSSQISFWIAIVAFIISLVTFVISSLSSDDSTSEIVNTIKTEDKLLLNEISKELDQQKQYNEFLKVKIDSIVGEINRIKSEQHK